MIGLIKDVHDDMSL